MKKTAIGISDFNTVISENFYFVDKTLFIKDVIDGAQTLLYPRPRRFGKTLNLSMLNYFYTVKQDYAPLFDGLAIAQEPEYMKKQGKHPVIFISFKDVKNSTFEQCIESMSELIRLIYTEHSYLLNSPLLCEMDKVIYKSIMMKSASITDLQTSIKNLTQYLHMYHEEKVVILIDEYDMPIQAAYMYDYYDPLILFMRSFLSGCLKDNLYLEKAVLTGILRVAKESIFSGLNNILVASMIIDKSADKFGFTEAEVEKCLSDFATEDSLQEVKDWYDGYNFGKNTEIYNPWSILNYIYHKELRPYWVKTSGNELIKILLKDADENVKKELETLIEGGSLRKAIDDSIIYSEVDKSDDALWSFLLMCGYLRFDNIEYTDENCVADIRIPNKEVFYLFRTEIVRSWFSTLSTSSSLNRILTNLTTGDINEFRYYFIDFCQNAFSYFDVGGDNPEKFYHGFVLGLIASLRDSYTIQSNRESGFGRYDIMLIPHDISMRGIIFEFKKINRLAKENPDTAMENAKKQLVEKDYAAQLRQRGVETIVHIAAVFEKKQVWVEIF